jgi:PAT family beta-lactamase induction signal transducer AmpG
MVYKISTLMATALTTKFLLELGFTKTMIGGVNKGAGLVATIAGTLAGGSLMVKFGLKRSLWIFGILQAVAILPFAFLSSIGPNVTVLAVSMASENFFSGMATTAYLAFMASQTNRRFSATQYALLASLMGVPRTIFSASTGVIADAFGWPGFFIACTLFTIPGLLMLFAVKRLINEEPSPSR